jgi:hypothetical protein
MADLLTVKDDLTEEGWNGGALVRDEATGDHYVVSTIQLPWAEGVTETLVYPSDPTADPSRVTDVFVAGGRGMDREDALADLSARLDDDRLLDRAQALELVQGWETAGEFEAMIAYLLTPQPAEL